MQGQIQNTKKLLSRRTRKQKGADVPGQNIFSSPEHGDRVHMDLVDLYLPECFTYHSDTE